MVVHGLRRGSAREEDQSCDGKILSEGTWKPGKSRRNGPPTEKNGKVSARPAIPNRETAAKGEKHGLRRHAIFYSNNSLSVSTTSNISKPHTDAWKCHAYVIDHSFHSFPRTEGFDWFANSFVTMANQIRVDSLSMIPLRSTLKLNIMKIFIFTWLHKSKLQYVIL